MICVRYFTTIDISFRSEFLKNMKYKQKFMKTFTRKLNKVVDSR